MLKTGKSFQSRTGEEQPRIVRVAGGYVKRDESGQFVGVKTSEAKPLETIGNVSLKRKAARKETLSIPATDPDDSPR